jgi:hypothetical protein
MKMNEYQIREALDSFIVNANVDPDSDLFQKARAAINELDQFELVDKRYAMAIVWQIDDVLSIRPDLTEEQAAEVLGRVEDIHDASIGISWETLEAVADDLFPEGGDDD